MFSIDVHHIHRGAKSGQTVDLAFHENSAGGVFACREDVGDDEYGRHDPASVGLAGRRFSRPADDPVSAWNMTVTSRTAKGHEPPAQPLNRGRLLIRAR